jgi:hypothetical protein
MAAQDGSDLQYRVRGCRRIGRGDGFLARIAIVDLSSLRGRHIDELRCLFCCEAASMQPADMSQPDCLVLL